MATESLIVELDARTQKLDAALISTNKKLESLDKQTQRNDTSFFKLSKASSAVGSALGTMTSIAVKSIAAIAALEAAVVATAAASADYAKEIENAAVLTKVSVESMQSLSFATNTVGIDMEGLADISKDTSEKIGDFLNTGGGGFQDFADAMKLSKEEAKQAAEEFKGMAGPDILQSMVTQLEAANISSEQMSHALEGMGSEATRLIPLLSDSGAELERLKEQFHEVNVVLTETDIKKLGELSSSFNDLSSTFKATMGKFSVEYADQINSIIKSTQEGLKIVGDEFASGSFSDRMNSFYDAFTDSWAVAMGDNITVFDNFAGDFETVITGLATEFLEFTLTMPINIAIAGNKIKEIFADIWDEIKIKSAEANLILQEGLDLVGAGDIGAAQAALDSITMQADARDLSHNDEISQLEDAKDAILDKFRAEQSAATKKREAYAADSKERMRIDKEESDSKSSGGVNGVVSVSLSSPEFNSDELEGFSEFLMSKEELRIAAYDRERELIVDAEQALKDDAAIRYEQGLIDEQQYQDEVNKIQSDAARKTKKVNDTLIGFDQDKIDSAKSWTNAASAINNAFFEDNKAIGAGVIIANTAIGVSEGVKLGYPAAIPAVAAAVAQGAAALSSLNSASKGGGSAPSTVAAPVIADTERVTVSDTDVSGQSNDRVIVAATSDEIAAAINELMNGAKTSGVI